MSITEFTVPDFMKDVTSDTVMANMLATLPTDIDKTEGGFVWDMLKPTALEKAEMVQFYMVQTLKLLHPMWAEGTWLDLHAQENGLERKAANKAYGVVTVTGTSGTTIAEGFVFCVPADGGAEAIPFATLEEATIPDTGSIDIEVEAVNGGTSSNVDADTITIMQSPINGITKITNAAATTGGTAEESDDDLRQRIDDALAGNGESFVGNNADYKRWAEEISGVGFAHTIPEYDGPNSVKVVVIDANGYPANDLILANVKTHIFGTGRKDASRLAPIGVINYDVVAPAQVEVNLSFKLKLENDYTQETVVADFKAQLAKYYASLAEAMGSDGSEVKFYKVAALLTDTAGVKDIDDFLMNGSEENIAFSEEQYPVTGTVTVTIYE